MNAMKPLINNHRQLEPYLNKVINGDSELTNDQKAIFYLAMFRIVQEMPIANRTQYDNIRKKLLKQLMNTKYKVLILRQFNVNTKNGTAEPYLINLSTMKLIFGIPHTTKLNTLSTNNLYGYVMKPYTNQTTYKANYNAARFTMATYLTNKSTNLSVTKMSNVNRVKTETYNYLRNTPYKHYLKN